MITTKSVFINVRAMSKRWTEHLGYEVKPFSIIEVPVEKLPINSNKKLNCICDECGSKFERQFQILMKRDIHLCYSCAKKDASRKSGLKTKNTNRPHVSGENHPRWKTDKDKLAEYKARVYSETRKHKPIWSKWENADKLGMCGKKGAYQLDHKVSIRYGFDNHIPPHIIGGIKNLEIITWENNRQKYTKNSIDVWELLD